MLQTLQSIISLGLIRISLIADLCYQGGFLGFYCTHEYAHTKMNFIGRLPYALKGLDAVIFAVLLRGFGFEVFLRPILKTDFDDEYEDGGIIYPPDGDRIATDLHEIKFGQGYEECRTSEVRDLTSTGR